MSESRPRPLCLLYLDSIGVRGYLGGSHLSLLDVMTSMVQRGHKVVLACPYEDLLSAEAQKRGIETQLFSLGGRPSTQFHWMGRRFFNWFAALAAALVYLRAGMALWRLVRAVRPDVVHCNDMFLAISAGVACRLAGKPSVWHLRTIPSLSVPRIAVGLYARLAALLSDRIIANSRATAGFLAGSPASEKVMVVYNGIDLGPFRALDDGPKVRLQLGIPMAAFVIATFSRVIPRKGHDVLIDTMARLSHSQDPLLLVVGHYEATGDYYRSLCRSVMARQLELRVRFVGFQLDIRPYLAAADVVVSASKETEAFGRTLVESMAAGKPVIATRLGGHVEIVEDGVTGLLVQPDSSQEMSEAITRVRDSARLSASMGQRGRARAERLFGIDACAMQIDGLYRELEPSGEGKVERHAAVRTKT